MLKLVRGVRAGISLLELVLLIFLLLVLFGTAPWYPYSRDWGYGPSGAFFVVLLIVVVVALVRRRDGGPEL